MQARIAASKVMVLCCTVFCAVSAKRLHLRLSAVSILKIYAMREVNFGGTLRKMHACCVEIWVSMAGQRWLELRKQQGLLSRREAPRIAECL